MRGLLLYTEADIWQSGYLFHVASAPCCVWPMCACGLWSSSWPLLGELGACWQVQLIETHICSGKSAAWVQMGVNEVWIIKVSHKKKAGRFLKVNTWWTHFSLLVDIIGPLLHAYVQAT